MAATYETPGKQAFRELLLAIAAQDGVRTYGTFFGQGADSRMFSAAGLDVIACEIVQAKHDALRYDALTHGYRCHFGRAGKLAERREMFHADFDGGPSPANFREVRRIAAISDKWLAVTLSMDHQRDASMMGEAAFHTIPAWLTGASGFTLEYLSRYVRNGYGQVMWVAILQRREGKGTAHQVLPVQIAYSIRERGYWASRPFYGFQLTPHRYSPRNEREKRADHQRYLSKLKVRLESRICKSCDQPFQPSHGRQMSCTSECRKTTYRKAWYAANRESQIAAVKLWKKHRSIMARPAEPSAIEEVA